MNTRLALTAAALLAFCPALHAQTLPAAPAVPAAPTAPASAPGTLRYKFAVGQVHRYEYDMDMNTLMQTGQTGAGIPINITLHMIMRQTVKSVRPADGAATVETQIESVHMLRSGQEMPLPEEIDAKLKQPFIQVILPTGKILSVDAPGMSGLGAPGMDVGRSLFGTTALLPDTPVKVGDNWKGAADAAMGAQTTFTATLTGVDQKNGAALATIQQKQTGTFDKPMTENGMTMQGRTTNTATQVFDTAAGMVQSATGTDDTDMTMTFPNAAAGGTTPTGMPSAMKMQMQRKYTMTRLSDTPPTAIAPVQ